jgi:ribosomal protein L11 methyltransferase
VESVCDELADDLAALSTSVEDADAGSAAEEPVFDEPGVAATAAWRRARVSALFVDDAAATAAAAALAATRGGDGVRIVAIAEVADRDWVRLTQAQFGPAEVAPGFWIVPSWSEVPANARQVIRLDPGRAFGTGSHPTTRMCLRWMLPPRQCHWRRLAARAGLRDRLGRAGDRGEPIRRRRGRCGRHRPGRGRGDRSDARQRRCTARRPARQRRRPLPLVVANILAAPLKLLAPLLAALVDEGGALVLSGILARQADELVAAYAASIELVVADEDDGWILMVGRRHSAGPMA